MSIYEKLKEDLKESIKSPEKRNLLKYIVGELQRLPDKEIDDIKTIKLLKKLIKDSEEVIKLGNGSMEEFNLISLIKEYLPIEASQDEIRKWISDNIDFSQYKNKMQAMSTIVEHFGVKSNGNVIRGVLLTLDV